MTHNTVHNIIIELDESINNVSDMIMLTINSIFNFIILNCMFESSTSFKNSFLNTLSNDTLKNIVNIDILLENIKTMNLESNIKCDIKSILLLHLFDWNIKMVTWETYNRTVLVGMF